MLNAPEHEPLGGTLAFMRLLWSLDHALHKRSKWMRRHRGVTGPQRLALRIIGLHPDVSAGALARTLSIHPSTLTGILRRLERQGLVTRRGTREDRRRAHLRLTARGRTTIRASHGSIEGIVTRALQRARPGQVAAATALLAQLVTALE